jgi:hypothetical protein
MEGHAEMGLFQDNFDPSVVAMRMRDDGYESRSGSDNVEGASGDDQDLFNNMIKDLFMFYLLFWYMQCLFNNTLKETQYISVIGFRKKKRSRRPKR